MTMIRPALTLIAVMTALTGLAYPLAMTGLATAVVPHRAEGSLIVAEGGPVGSALVGQAFAGAGYLHPRPSAVDYDAAAGAGTNLGPTSAALRDAVAERRTVWEAENGTPAPMDAVTASGSGLDPDVSLVNARGQARRIAEARGVDLADVLAVLAAAERRPLWGLYGSYRVNVLAANLALDAAHPMPPAAH
ncbi:potassium-transporting ATPase subunit KdpC [Falsirhodobacter sp. 20TX0035]|uniref:potassium-transporting ATPase subunit KdpC n=1 Tax=Falsirhodobacter sp. 20TX0035 TaxID=3022019 RepID=UPI00232FC817|nr:potassium-transporting ATPase subunit KdpC [Falsirhodobacter sp. 20TX0035]MDB6452579.1 potassium-transporting ATPase subunit KdpC [Falsirhodobacter sp. 20TX0035]